MIRIEVAATGSIGYIIAIETSDAPGTGYDWNATASAVVVGQAAIAIDGCKAWLWPQAGTYPGRGMSTPADTARTHAELAAKLRKRHDEKGAWWS